MATNTVKVTKEDAKYSENILPLFANFDDSFTWNKASETGVVGIITNSTAQSYAGDRGVEIPMGSTSTLTFNSGGTQLQKTVDKTGVYSLSFRLFNTLVNPDITFYVRVYVNAVLLPENEFRTDAFESNGFVQNSWNTYCQNISLTAGDVVDFDFQAVTYATTTDLYFDGFKFELNDREINICSDYTPVQSISTSLDNRVVVRQASDFGVIDSTKEYFLDGVIDMGATSIEVPSGGINIKGYDFGISGLTSSENSYTMFTSPIGGSGDVLWENFKIEVTGTSSKVLDIVGDAGVETFEIVAINFNNCTSLGEIDSYRQGLETRTGRFGGTPNLILSGTWIGGYVAKTSIVRSLIDGAYSLYEKGTAFTMASRFSSDQNIDLNATVAFFDFDNTNFMNPSTLQLNNCIVTRNGVADSGDATIIPNVTKSDTVSFWKGNVGVPNTFVGGTLNLTTEVTTTISVAGTYVDLAGTYTSSDLQHFDVPANGQLRHLGDSPREFRVIFEGTLACTASDEIDLKVVVWDNSASVFVDYKITRRVVNNLQGGRDVAFFTILTNIVLDQNDYVKLQVANVAATNNITAELGDDFIIEER